MTTYAQLLQAFKQNGISDEKSLAAVLQRLPESGRGDLQYIAATGKDEVSKLGINFCRSLADVARHLVALYDGGGIQQFSLNVKPRIGEESIKKALFLSRTPTVFTQHQFRYSSVQFWNSADGDGIDTEDWIVSHDFIRDVFRYREAIERGQLIILPSSIAESHYRGDISGGSTHEGTVSLLEELERTRVFNLSADPQLVDAIIANYKTEHQLISLPDLNVPWIKNLDIGTILKVRADHGDSLDRFQRAYHSAILAFIENHRSLDFARISRQINQDLIAPRVAEIEKNYKRITSLHRNLALTGATVALIPIGGVILSGALLNQILVSDIIKEIPSAIAG